MVMVDNRTPGHRGAMEEAQGDRMWEVAGSCLQGLRGQRQACVCWPHRGGAQGLLRTTEPVHRWA